MFNLKDFIKFKKIHHSILSQKNLLPQTVSNQFLFLTRFHPQLVNEFLINRKKNIINKPKLFLPFLLNYFLDFFSKNYFVNEKNLKQKKIVFISTIEHEFLLNKQNQHLNELIKIFKDKDYVELRKSHISVNLEKKINLKNKIVKKKIFFKNNIGFFNEMKMIINLYLNFRLNKFYYLNKYIKNKNIIKKIFSLSAFFSSINNYRFYLQLNKIFKILNPKIIFFPYEGYPWERLIVKAAKDHNLNIICVGYQKSVITKYSDLIKTNFKNKLYNPDKIICKSKIDYKKLLDKGSLNKNQLIVGGKTSKFKFVEKNFNKIKILILPEAWSIEERNMLKFTLECAKIFPNFQFIFRPHPSSISNIVKIKFNHIKNFQISKNSFVKDTNQCNFVFYRGSYSVIKACEKGLIPIYIKFQNDFDININPLYEIEKKIFQLNDPKKLKKFIDISKTSKFSKKRLFIFNHCNKINLKLDKKLIKNNFNLQ